jgi:peptidoglycan/LPS O-acetylase OafA/YrhL
MLVYRKDIDGLRAVAVLLVIAYHLGFSFIPGGFIGVDIFFVLSGFLITGIINTKIINNSFTFSDFYLKRLRRIYPLLILVILITSLIGYFILLPDDYYQLSKSAGLAFISICNFYFNNISSGYFGSSTEIMPLLHTWSLAVEEQFYLIWPITLISIYKIIGDKNKIPIIMLTVTVVLLFLSQYLALDNNSSSYFLIPARAFELLSGATLALYWKKLPIIKSTLQNILSIIALCILIAVSLLLDKTSTFPGLNAGIVCIATCLFIYTGQSKSIANKWLSFKPVVYVGTISYSLYLWHWPLIAYVNYLSIEKSLDIQIYVFILTFALSITSFHLVENTFRFTKKFNLKKTSFLFLGLPIIFLSTFIMVNKLFWSSTTGDLTL